MKTILYISCSPRGAASHSRIIADELVDRLLSRHPGAEMIRRDLAANPPSFVDTAFSAAILGPQGAPPPALEESETLIRELESCDALVLATPMHNYGVPAVLKAWIDQIVRIHRSFRSTPEGKVGVLTDRPVYVVVASGGWFSGPSPTGTPPQPDFLTQYLRAVFATIGLRDIAFITLEGVTRGPDIAAKAYAAARQRIAEL